MSLEVKQVCVKLQKSEILKNISFGIHTGEFVSLLGASGCGKTTLLKSIAGLLYVEPGGDIAIDGESILKLPPEKRGTVIVFQDLRLFPHMTVERNIAFSMELKKVPKKERNRKVKELLLAVQLPGFEKRKIREMSGGQCQRVALARALAAEPKLLLLDEPFSSLDENLRNEMGRLVKKLHTERKLTTVMVTHDKAEAMKFSDRIALMQEGEIVQYSTPRELFENPGSRAVADYMGQTNYIRGTVKNGRFVSGVSGVAQMETDMLDGTYDLMVRPSKLRIKKAEAGRYQVLEVLFEGETAEITIGTDTENFRAWMLCGEWEAMGMSKGDFAKIYADAGILFPVKEEE